MTITSDRNAVSLTGLPSLTEVSSSLATRHSQRKSTIDKDIRIEFGLNNVTRIGLGLFLVLACSLFVVDVISNFTVGTLSDERATIPLDTLSTASDTYPTSPRLHARVAEVLEEQGDLTRAQEHATQAIGLSPNNYSYRLLLASIEEAVGDRTAAEQSLRAGLALAPNKPDVHWQLANVLLRKGDLNEAVEHFRAACSRNTKLLPVTLNLIWRTSGGDPDLVQEITGSQPEARIKLAVFLVKHEQTGIATKIFSELGPRARLAAAEAHEFLDSLIAAGEEKHARDLWISISGDAGLDHGLIWNGSFELESAKDLMQFDWMSYNNEYAKVRIGTGAAHTGARSLRMEFAGRDTTRVDGQFRQLIVVQPNTHYKLEYYANAERLVCPEGPRIVVRQKDSQDEIAASEPIVAGKPGWQRIDFDLNAPATPNGEPVALVVTIVRRPRFSYDEPTRGMLYFDDFTLTEQPERVTAQLSSNRNRY
ncbi:MAG TPA: tetratricopeptide repeat protein [Blastocatellia bacterium]|nr:tetratricopeptide repeat protein [Blastocatellia bacterium]